MSSSAFQQINPSQAEALKAQGQHLFVDVRSPQEFAAGHVEGSYNVPILFRGPRNSGFNPDFVEVIQRHFKREAALVFV